MLTWDELVGICENQLKNVPPGVFERVLIDLAEPDFAKHTLCIDAEFNITTVVGTKDYELPLGVVGIKRVDFRGLKLDPTSEDQVNPSAQYQSDGTTLNEGTPTKYYLLNDRINLFVAPSEAANLRVCYASLPTYAKKRYRALADTSTTAVYLDLGIGEPLADDTVTFNNITRSLTGNCSAYTLDGNRHKYTVGSIAGQVEGDEIEIDVHPYVPMIPEIYAPLLVPYGLAMGFASLKDTAMHGYHMAEYERLRDEVAGERPSRGYPEGVVSNWEGIQ